MIGVEEEVSCESLQIGEKEGNSAKRGREEIREENGREQERSHRNEKQKNGTIVEECDESNGAHCDREFTEEHSSKKRKSADFDSSPCHSLLALTAMAEAVSAGLPAGVRVFPKGSLFQFEIQPEAKMIYRKNLFPAPAVRLHNSAKKTNYLVTVALVDGATGESIVSPNAGNVLILVQGVHNAPVSTLTISHRSPQAAFEKLRIQFTNQQTHTEYFRLRADLYEGAEVVGLVDTAYSDPFQVVSHQKLLNSSSSSIPSPPLNISASWNGSPCSPNNVSRSNSFNLRVSTDGIVKKPPGETNKRSSIDIPLRHSVDSIPMAAAKYTEAENLLALSTPRLDPTSSNYDARSPPVSNPGSPSNDSLSPVEICSPAQLEDSEKEKKSKRLLSESKKSTKSNSSRMIVNAAELFVEERLKEIISLLKSDTADHSLSFEDKLMWANEVIKTSS